MEYDRSMVLQVRYYSTKYILAIVFCGKQVCMSLDLDNSRLGLGIRSV